MNTIYRNDLEAPNIVAALVMNREKFRQGQPCHRAGCPAAEIAGHGFHAGRRAAEQAAFPSSR